ncbi:hypothetical protein HYX16_04030 [Candidatus Woesearchaeota archaeon]|nr:hypothetical protein [Candidatus Woesearchaeota archaeon]
MDFFKKKGNVERLPPLPEFPRLPSDRFKSMPEPDLPFYDEQLSDKEFKKVKPTEDFSFEDKFSPPELIEKEDYDLGEFSSNLKKEMPMLESEDHKPIFVKMSKYKESIKTISAIKEKLGEAERVFNNLKRLKEQEDRELEEWQNKLNEIRHKIIKVDKDLFEV